MSGAARARSACLAVVCGGEAAPSLAQRAASLPRQPHPTPPCLPLVLRFRPGAVLPLAMTGTYVDNSSSAAGMASIMRYSLSNIEPHSVKLWCAPSLRGSPPPPPRAPLVPAAAASRLAAAQRAPRCLRNLHRAPPISVCGWRLGGFPCSLPSVLPLCLPRRAPFALSYAVLAWAGYCLYMHYKSVREIH